MYIIYMYTYIYVDIYIYVSVSKYVYTYTHTRTHTIDIHAHTARCHVDLVEDRRNLCHRCGTGLELCGYGSLVFPTMMASALRSPASPTQRTQVGILVQHARVAGLYFIIFRGVNPQQSKSTSSSQMPGTMLFAPTIAHLQRGRAEGIGVSCSRQAAAAFFPGTCTLGGMLRDCGLQQL